MFENVPWFFHARIKQEMYMWHRRLEQNKHDSLFIWRLKNRTLDSKLEKIMPDF